MDWHVIRESKKSIVFDQKYVDIRLLQRNAKKRITAVEGLSMSKENLNILKKKLSKKFGCSIYINEGNLLLQGTHSLEIKNYLIQEGICETDYIRLHG